MPQAGQGHMIHFALTMAAGVVMAVVIGVAWGLWDRRRIHPAAAAWVAMLAADLEQSIKFLNDCREACPDCHGDKHCDRHE